MQHTKRWMRIAVLVAGAVGAVFGQETTRVSVYSSGAQGNDDSEGPAISAGGRYVAFDSGATNLAAGDTNGVQDIFVHDRQTGTTSRVSVDSSGIQGSGGSYEPAVSADGRFVAFGSYASNLVPADTNTSVDVFVHDRQTGSTSRVSVSSSGTQGNNGCGEPSMSADGRYVTFASNANNLVAGDTNHCADIILHDRLSGLTSRMSVHASGTQGNNHSHDPSISADGRHVAFRSRASNLTTGDTNWSIDIFVHDRLSHVTTRVSVDSSGVQGNDDSGEPSISADGRLVAFWSDASNLVTGDTNDHADVFVHDRLSGLTSRVSVSSSGVQGDYHSYRPSITVDGRYVAFDSGSTNLVPGDTNGMRDIFVHDRQLGTTSRVSVDSSGAQGLAESYDASISDDGRRVAFWSNASNLVPGDTNGAEDIFVHGCGSVGTTYCIANPSSTGASADISAVCSASSAQGNLTLDAVPVPNLSGIFFHGTSQTQVVFGNGFLCASGDIVRGAVIQARGNLATYTYDNSDSKHDLGAYVGSTRHFQYWFRDPAGGGALFNTSNAISITILP